MFGMRERQPEDIKRTNNRQNFNNGGDGGSAGGSNDDSSDVYWASFNRPKVLLNRKTQIWPQKRHLLACLNHKWNWQVNFRTHLHLSLVFTIANLVE